MLRKPSKLKGGFVLERDFINDYFRLTFRSYTQVGNFTTKSPAKSRFSIYYFPFNKAPKPDLREAAVIAMCFIAFCQFIGY